MTQNDEPTDLININIMDANLGVITVTLPDNPDGTYADGAAAGVVAYLRARDGQPPRDY